MAFPEVAQVSFPYISIKLNDGFSLTWSKDYRGPLGGSSIYGGPNYFMSLTVKRILDKKSDTQKATTGTLTLTYVPGDINLIEVELAKSKLRFLYQYGYYDKGYQLKCTDWYAALISKISTNIDEGKITYTIDFVAGAAAYCFADTQEYVLENPTTQDITKLIHDIAKNSLSANPNSLPFNWNYKFIESKSNTDYIVNDSLLKATNVAPNKRTLTIPKNVNGGFAQITDLLSKIVYKGVSEYTTSSYDMAGVNESLRKNSRYILMFQDESNDIKSTDLGFYIKRVYKTSPTEEYTFNWGTKDSTILNWSPSYNAMVGLTRSVENAPNVSQISYFTFVGDTAQIHFTEDSSLKDTPISYSNDNESVEHNVGAINYLEKALVTNAIYEKYSQYNYTASLEMFGVIEELQIGQTHIFVRPMVNNQMHHTGGEYIVTGVTDTIGTNGFTTKLDLVKVTEYGSQEFTTKITSVNQNIFG